MNSNRKTNEILICVLIVTSVLLVVSEDAKADYVIGTPENLGQAVNSAFAEVAFCISTDGLVLYFGSDRPGGYGGYDIWVAKRTSTDNEWDQAENLGPQVNTSSGAGAPCLSADGLELYYGSDRPDGHGHFDIWVTRRATKEAEWNPPVNLGPPINTASSEIFPSLSPDGLELFFSDWLSYRPGGHGVQDLWVSTRANISDPWGVPANLGLPVNSSSGEGLPALSDDGLSLLFTSGRPGGYGGDEIWVTTRTSNLDLWSEPVHLGPQVNTSWHDGSARLAEDNSALYFYSTRPGSYGDSDLWKVSIDPVVDLNGDGIVDAADICIMVDHWGTDYSLCDIGPTPFGDGIVDVEDLIILAGHLFEEIPPVEEVE
jgi:Tol biopolymer transport system component